MQAKDELLMMPDELPWGKQKRAMMVEILQNQQSWKKMREVAHGMRMEFPEDADWWIADAYATRRDQSIDQAREILLEGLVHHYENAMIRYNLACYACQLGSMGECLDLLKEAVRRDDRYKLDGHGGRRPSGVRQALCELGGVM